MPIQTQETKAKAATFAPAHGAVSTCLALVMNVPKLFQDPEFIAWLTSWEPKFTWHRGATPNDYSDVVVCVDPTLSGEGSNSDMPEAAWQMIVDECRKHFRPSEGYHIMVRLQNLAD